MHQQLYGYLTESNLLTTKQFGFRPKLSTEVALAHFTDRILEKLDNGMLTGAVFLDLSIFRSQPPIAKAQAKLL